MSQKSLFELLLMNVIAVPCWPNRPTLPIWNEMQRTFSKCSHEILTSLERNWRAAFEEASLWWVFVRVASAGSALPVHLRHRFRGRHWRSPHRRENQEEDCPWNVCFSHACVCVCVYVHAGVRTQRCFSLRMSYGKNFSKATTMRGERTTFFTALRCLEVWGWSKSTFAWSYFSFWQN